eukprot:CAMPEP_0185905316 /NCGR_PEP_ID=MMETSP0196C-20130402/4527_1 /TAXON_ID=2932 /ORGANISM="Alexandrium fundyense, Strain CCMP1719" /LENGTH=85 /DNA_ID=CAMNT_0028624811 /DNA_START=116 /DNA_END=370 /DNA_ORIENTATION=+
MAAARVERGLLPATLKAMAPAAIKAQLPICSRGDAVDAPEKLGLPPRSSTAGSSSLSTVKRPARLPGDEKAREENPKNALEAKSA